MSRDELSDSALVLTGHGTTQNAESALPVRQHAGELRRRKLFAEVHEAFWKQEPDVVEAVERVTAPRVFIAPLFISEGYFSEEVIPRALGFRGPDAGVDFSRVKQRGAQQLLYCRPVGSHDRMTGVLLARARQVVEKFPFPRVPKWQETTLFIAGHGTERDEGSRQIVEHQVELIRALALYAGVHAIFLEERPGIVECYALAQTRYVIVVPFFISDGLHVQEDIPVGLGEPERVVKQRMESGQPTWRNPTEKNRKLVWYAPAVGTEPLMADVILERVREAAKWD